MHIEFSKDYDMLLRQAKSLQKLLRYTEKNLTHYKSKVDSCSEQTLHCLQLNLESEKNMNHKLTLENMQMDKLITTLKLSRRLDTNA